MSAVLIRLLPLTLILSATLRAQSSLDLRVSGPLGPVPHVAVYLMAVAGEHVPEVPSRSVISQRDLRFDPRIVVVSPGSVVTFPNNDNVVHNVFHPGVGRSGFDLGTYSPSEGRSATFRDEGVYAILCQVHPEMAAYVVVVRSVARGISDDYGRVQFTNLAPGTYRIQSWHRRFKNLDQTVSVSHATRLTLTLTPGSPTAPGVLPEGR